MDFRKFAGVLRYHRNRLRTTPMGASAWVGLDVLEDVVEEYETLIFGVWRLNVCTEFRGYQRSAQGKTSPGRSGNAGLAQDGHWRPPNQRCKTFVHRRQFLANDHNLH